MKITFRLLIFVFFVIAGFTLFKIAQHYLPTNLFSKEQHYASKLQKSSEQSVQQVESLRITNEYVFPYDFLKKPYPENWSTLLLKNPTHYRNNSEKDNVNFYEMMKKFGIDLAKEGQSFLILKADVRMGFDLSDQGPWIFPKVSQGIMVIQVKLPPPGILAFALDIEPKRPGWPSMGINPDSWSKLSSFLEAEIRQNVLQDDNLDLVKHYVEVLLRNTLESAGFNNIEFVYEQNKKGAIE